MSADFLHPVIRDVFDRHFPGLRTTVLSPEGEEVEVCSACGGLERLADHPCPACCNDDETDAASGGVSGV